MLASGRSRAAAPKSRISERTLLSSNTEHSPRNTKPRARVLSLGPDAVENIHVSRLRASPIAAHLCPTLPDATMQPLSPSAQVSAPTLRVIANSSRRSRRHLLARYSFQAAAWFARETGTLPSGSAGAGATGLLPGAAWRACSACPAGAVPGCAATVRPRRAARPVALAVLPFAATSGSSRSADLLGWRGTPRGRPSVGGRPVWRRHRRGVPTPRRAGDRPAPDLVDRDFCAA